MAAESTFSCDYEDFEERVVAASHERPILVDFWADWCAPCHAIAPHLDKALRELDGRVRLAKVEVDEGENMKLAGHYRLRGFPTIMLFHAGRELGRFSGARAAHWIQHWVGEHLAAAGD
jgi:putative thioredoxin